MPSYHHGDLPAQVLAQAATMIARDGAETFSLRAVAAELGVSHTAPRHHFGDRQGVFTALAVQGHRQLADALTAAAPRGFAEVGAAYVDFALTRPGHFAVMFAPDLVDTDDADLVDAIDSTRRRLADGVATQVSGGPEDVAVAAVASWSLVHGIATLARSGALASWGLPAQAGADVHAMTLRAARLLFTRPEPPHPSNPSKRSPV